MTPDIISKLNDFLSTTKFSGQDVMYFLLEIRKILDRIRTAKGSDHFPTLRFYADWVVHTEKSKITSQIQVIMNQIDKSIPANIKTNKTFTMAADHLDFIYMRELRNELVKFSEENNLIVDQIKDENKWIDFIKSLVKILTNQPILNPIPAIKSFSFEPAIDGAAVWIIEFNDSRGTCKFGNYY